MAHFTELRHELESYLDEAAIEQVHKAYLFAAQAHKGQHRETGDPYITHPLAAARILAEMRMDAETISAAILHDVIEDTTIDKNVLTTEFNQEIANLVDGVSKFDKIKFQDRAEAQAENFRKMLLAMAKDIRVILVKLADRLHNMRTICALPPEKRQRIARETLEIYAPIAQRLGMHVFRIEFEDLCFSALYPMRYRVLQETVRKIKRANKRKIGHLETAIKESIEKHKLPSSAVWLRERHLFGIYREMRERRLSLTDIMATYTFCIVVDSLDTCYRALGAVHNLYKPLPERFRDYIALPKANGYQALHTTLFGPYGVPIEVQIRTIEMENKAGSGIATHWLNAPACDASERAHARAQEWLKRLLDIQQSTGSSLEFIEHVKIDLFPDEVYVFTPQGEILELPRGSTPVDLAYAIHSDIGNHAVAARIDRRIAPLSTILANSQTVEIITEPSASPNPAWLNFVATGRARSRIRHYLKNQLRTEAVAFGRRLLETALTSLKTKWSALPAENLAQVLRQFQYKHDEDLLEAIGLGNQMALLIAKRLLNPFDIEATPVSSQLVQSMVIKGTEGELVNFAECCRPIAGDAVVGILTKGHGITIHQESCKQVAKFSKHPERYISVQWDERVKNTFKTDIKVEVVNQPGVLAQLAASIAKVNANIDNVSLEQQEGNYCIMRLTVSVHDRIHLAQVLRRLRTVNTVIRLTRGK